MKPVNKHLLIEPLKHESFISSDQGVYEEIGIVLAIAEDLSVKAKVGDKVFFDPWLAAKYPKNDKEWYWLVRWEDIRGVESVQD